jgi:hypothetical protein
MFAGGKACEHARRLAGRIVRTVAAVVLYGPKPAMNARYFPQPLTSFTLDALGVFYLSLSLSVLFMIGQRGMATLVTYLRGAIGLVAIIVIATLLNIRIFHFSAHPRHVVYLATYVVMMIGTVVILWWDRRETRGAADRVHDGERPGQRT